MTFSKNEIRMFTKLLRESNDPMWVRIRELLAKRGVEVSTSFLVESFPDDARFHFGIVVTEDGSVIQYGFDYLNRAIENGDFVEWQNLTDAYEETPYFESIKTGMELRNAK